MVLVVLEALLLLGGVAVVGVRIVIVSLSPPQPAYAAWPGEWGGVRRSEEE